MAEVKAVDVSAVASDSYLDSLKRRLDILEKKVLGKPGVNQPPLVSTVKSLQKKLDSLGGSVAQAWQKIESLEELLSLERTGYLKLSEDAKAELLLNYAEHLKPLSERGGLFHLIIVHPLWMNSLAKVVPPLDIIWQAAPPGQLITCDLAPL